MNSNSTLGMTSTEETLDILLVNDDSFEAEGIDVMFDALVEAGYNVTLVAPKEQQSGTGTLINVDNIFQPTEVVNFETDKWFVDGSPVVTTLAALDFVLDGEAPDLVISGINEGANIGSNIAISSGTVSAAATAIQQRGVPAIAVSAGSGSEDTLAEAYEAGADFVVDIIHQLESESEGGALLPEGTGLSVNIPTEFPEGVEEIRAEVLTELDEASNINLRFGELPTIFGEGAGVLFSFNPPISPAAITDPISEGQQFLSGAISEGQQFLSGAITVTPIDGSWDAGAAQREVLEQRVMEAPDDAVAEPLEILITNDDGFEAEGIEVLYETLTEAGHTVTLVAPKEQQSGKGTVLDVDAILQPTEVVEFEANQWFVDAAPRTTTWAGLDFILDGEAPDLVISGINEGENIGPGGAVSSGTVSAAVTALLRDVPAIAISAGIDFVDESVTSEAYEIGADFLVDLIAQLQTTQGSDAEILPDDVGLNVNIPVRFPEGVEEIQGVRFTSTSEITPFQIDFGEVPGGAGLRFFPADLPDTVDPVSEGGQFLSGFITVTPINPNWSTTSELRQEIGELIAPLLSDPIFNLIEGTDDSETLLGETENDQIMAEAGDDTVAGGLGDDFISGDDGDDRLRGDLNQRRSAEEGGNDTISGGAGNDQIAGKAGDDVLLGDAGDDQIWGDQGDDLLNGGLGNDTLHGDSGDLFGGADTFVLAAGQGVDTIVDFEAGLDVIGLAEGIIFENLSFTAEGSDLKVVFGTEMLAIVEGVDALSEADFVSV
ncbi:MAG: 5'/3'-nucleotidase SurE [Microcoleaceae cyanobacterium]